MVRPLNNSLKQVALVAGGAGFIGQHVCTALLEAGNHVLCIDNFSSGTMNNIFHLKKEYPFTFNFQWIDVIDMVDNNLSSEIKAQFLPNAICFTQIWNLACPASPPFYQENPLQTIRTCFTGTENLLRLARLHNCPMLHASTSEIYGDPLECPQRETYWGNVNTIGKRSCYDEGKRIAETLCLEHHRKYQTDIRIVRIFNTYGPYMRVDDGRVISNFINQALSNQPITIYGDGTQTRSFCYISDLVDGMLSLMSLKKSAVMPVINLGNNHEQEVGNVAIFIRDTIHQNSSSITEDKKSEIIYKSLPEDDPQQRVPDLTRALTLLPDWKPKVQFKEGLLKTIEYFKSL